MTLLRHLLLGLLSSAPVLAFQSINVDIGSSIFGAGVPDATYGAAANSAGTWNDIDADLFLAGATYSSGPLMDLSGAPTAVTIALDSFGPGFIAYEFNEPNTVGDDEALLDDIYYVDGPHIMTINGLAPGAYTVYVYAMAPDDPTAQTTVDVAGSPDPIATVFGDFAGGFVRNITHSQHRVTVAAGGAIQINLDFAHLYNSVAGFQITDGTGAVLGSNYCTANPNSTSVSATIGAVGSGLAADNDVTLTATALPQNAFGFFLASATQGFSPNPGGSAGNLCLGGAIGRYVGAGQILNSGAAGSFALVLDLASTPQPTGPVAIVGGQTWNFQAWYRDAVGGSATSNLTDGLSIGFQ